MSCIKDVQDFVGKILASELLWKKELTERFKADVAELGATITRDHALEDELKFAPDLPSRYTKLRPQSEFVFRLFKRKYDQI